MASLSGIVRRLLPLLILTLLLAGCLPRPRLPEPVVGVLHDDQLWQGEVLIGGDVTIAADARLVILPGTRVRFLPPEGFPTGETEHPYFPGSELNVAGVLIAEGTAAAPIVFAAADAAAPPGSWGAVNFAEQSRGVLRHCIFRQADSAIHSREAAVEVTDSLFDGNLVGVRFHTSDMWIENNLLRNNGAALRFHFGQPVVRANRFADNRINLFITSHPRDYLIESNHFGAPRDYHVVLGEEVPEDVALTGNHWETPAEALFFDGRRAPYLGRVVLEPMLSIPPAATGPSWIR